MKKYLYMLLLMMSLSAVNINGDVLVDPDVKREIVEDAADQKLEELKERSEGDFEEVFDEYGVEYQSDMFGDDGPFQIMDILAMKANRLMYKLRAIVQELIFPIATVLLFAGVMLIILFWKKSNPLVTKGLLIMVFGMSTLLIFTYYPLLKKYVGTMY